VKTVVDPRCGDRHIEWTGECAGLLIVSAPSPVMEVTDNLDSYFYIQTLAMGADRRLRLLHPQRITVEGQIGAPQRIEALLLWGRM
jgi:hypothetical protein